MGTLARDSDLGTVLMGMRLCLANAFCFSLGDTEDLWSIIFFKFLFILRESTSGGGMEGEEERENPKQLHYYSSTQSSNS